MTYYIRNLFLLYYLTLLRLSNKQLQLMIISKMPFMYMSNNFKNVK